MTKASAGRGAHLECSDQCCATGDEGERRARGQRAESPPCSKVFQLSRQKLLVVLGKKKSEVKGAVAWGEREREKRVFVGKVG